MLDVIIPIPTHLLEAAEDCIQDVAEQTDIPTRLVVVFDGCTKSDASRIDGLLRALPNEFSVIRNHQPQYLNGCISASLDYLLSPLVALIPPEVRLDDEGWFGKMWKVFQRDPQTYVVDAAPNTQSTSANPVRRNRHRLPEDIRFAMLKREALTRLGVPIKDGEPVHFWSKRSLEDGGTSWHAPAVRYSVLDVERQETWRARSPKRKAQFESPLPTTQASSTPTTTEEDGSMGFTV
jgi:hypothetical protein